MLLWNIHFRENPYHSLKGLALLRGPHQETHTRMNTFRASCVVAYPPNLADLAFVPLGLYQVHVAPVHDTHSRARRSFLPPPVASGFPTDAGSSRSGTGLQLCASHVYTKPFPFPPPQASETWTLVPMTSIKTFVMFVSDFPVSTRALIG